MSPVNNRARLSGQSRAHTFPDVALPPSSSHQGALLAALSGGRKQYQSLQPSHAGPADSCMLGHQAGRTEDSHHAASQHSLLLATNTMHESQISQQTTDVLMITQRAAQIAGESPQAAAMTSDRSSAEASQVPLPMQHASSDDTDVDAGEAGSHQGPLPEPSQPVIRQSRSWATRTAAETAVALVKHATFEPRTDAGAKQQQVLCAQQRCDSMSGEDMQSSAKRRRVCSLGPPHAAASRPAGIHLKDVGSGGSQAARLLTSTAGSTVHDGACASRGHSRSDGSATPVSPAALSGGGMASLRDDVATSWAGVGDTAEESSIPETPLPCTVIECPSASATMHGPSPRRKLASLRQAPASLPDDNGPPHDSSSTGRAVNTDAGTPYTQPVLCDSAEPSQEQCQGRHAEPNVRGDTKHPGAGTSSPYLEQPAGCTATVNISTPAEGAWGLTGLGDQALSGNEAAAVGMPPDSLQTGWSCRACTLLNTHAARTCAACGQPGGASHGGSACRTAKRAPPSQRASSGSLQPGVNAWLYATG